MRKAESAPARAFPRVPESGTLSSSALRSRSMTEPTAALSAPPRRIQPYAWATLLLLVAVAGIGAWLIRQLYTQAQQHAFEELRAVANLKTFELERWVADKTTYLAQPAAGSMPQVLQRWLRHGARADADRDALLGQLQRAKDLAAEHRGVWLFDASGKLLLAGQEEPSHAEHAHVASVREAFATAKPVLIDFHTEVAGGRNVVALEVVVPMFAGPERRPLAFLLYEIDPDQYIYPLIQRWPTASLSAEVMLLRRDGDEIVCLNELRLGQHAALTLRRKLGDSGSLAAAAMRQGDGAVTGNDYRGQAAFGVAARVASRDWLLLAKMDRDEVYAEAWSNAWAIAAAGVALMLLLAALGWLAFRHDRQRRHSNLLEAQIARGESERRLDYLIRFANDIVLLMDEDGNIIQANESAARGYGYRREDLLGRNIRELRHASTRDTVGAHLDAARRDGGTFFETLHQRRDGTPFPVEVSSQVFEHEGRRYRQSIVRDISDRKAQEQELRDNLERQRSLNRKLEEAQSQLLQAEKMASIGQLAAGIAHELNNPIGFVHSNLGTLDGYLHDLFAVFDAYEKFESGGDLGAVVDLKREKDFAYLRQDTFQLLEESKDGLARVRKIVQDLKDFSRVGDTDWRWADLHQGLDSTLNIVWNELKYKCKVAKEYGELPLVYCLPSQLNQVFMNILVNAGQAIEEKGEITLRSGRSGETVWVEISDTGKGIAAENLTRIFEPFYTTKPVGKGTGLGLSLSYSIVKKHQGRIEVKSEPGHGSTFRVVLPIQPAVEVETQSSEVHA